MRIYFNGLNEIRGVAAIAVVVHHIETYKQSENVVSLYDGKASSFIQHLGKNGVYLFFVLSGFLITYLLLAEKERTGNVQTLKFYIRRMLRIWPLYYLIVLISFFIFPFLVNHFDLAKGSYFSALVDNLSNDFEWKLLLFLLFLPNVALRIFPPVAGVSQAWSVGVEEQFYLLWPQLLKRSVKVIPVLIAVVCLKFFVMGFLMLLNVKLKDVNLKIAIAFLSSFNIELMALGGIGAYLLFHKRLSWLYDRTNAIASILVLCLISLALFFSVNYFLLSTLFLLMILLNVSDNHAVFRDKFFSFLGDISYGIYMYHPLVLFFVFTFGSSWFSNLTPLLYNFVLYALVIVITIVISYLSFRYFEEYFLKMKGRFEIIASGKPIKND
jgi:peptidoglycan/LPS O-acetylase OafA/YrhL